MRVSSECAVWAPGLEWRQRKLHCSMALLQVLLPSLEEKVDNNLDKDEEDDNDEVAMVQEAALWWHLVADGSAAERCDAPGRKYGNMINIQQFYHLLPSL